GAGSCHTHAGWSRAHGGVEGVAVVVVEEVRRAGGSVGKASGERGEAVARGPARSDARLCERECDEGPWLRSPGLGTGGEGRAHRLALGGTGRETRRAGERRAREGGERLAGREGEERAHARRLRRNPGRERDPRRQAGETERRGVESRDERRSG